MSPPPEAVLAAAALARRYGYRPVLRNVNLQLHAGDLVLLLGPNGAGKTTLLRVLAGVLRASAGRVTRRGVLALVGHEAMVYDALTARENLRFFARVHRANPAVVDALLDRLGLGDRADDRAGTLSRGMLQRLALARALVPSPDILLLDEPLTGLDRASSAVARTVLAEQRQRGTAVLAVSHHPEEMQDLATGAVQLVDGVAEPVALARA